MSSVKNSVLVNVKCITVARAHFPRNTVFETSDRAQTPRVEAEDKGLTIGKISKQECRRQRNFSTKKKEEKEIGKVKETVVAKDAEERRGTEAEEQISYSA